VTPTEWISCVDPDKNFHHENKVLKGLCVCESGEVRARFAFHVKPKADETVTLRIPADKDGDIIPLVNPASLRPFEPNAWVPEPNARFVLAMRGLAEQQELLDFRIARRDPSLTKSWAARYIRGLGVVVRPETHAVSVIKDSPAYAAGIRQGDEITEIDGIKLNSAWHARSLLVRTRPGETHALTFSHAGEIHTRQITLDALPANLALTERHDLSGWHAASRAG
jgi:PDZ domain-containing protein